MSILANMSIRRKQTLIIMGTSSVVLLLACAAFSIYEVITFRKAMVQDLSTLAEMMGYNTAAALDFNDAKSAGETLSALHAEPGIIGACIYTKDGKVFASYDRTNDSTIYTPPALHANGYAFEGQRLTLSRPIVHQGETVGTVYLESDMQALYSRLTRYAGIVGLVFAASVLIAFVLSNRLQRLVSGPILDLARMARSVALEKNYGLRARKQSNNELGELVDGFNDMLAQIQGRDAALQTARDGLESRVRERTGELAAANQSLVAEMAERKRGEQQVRMLGTALDAAANAIVITDQEGTIQSVNLAFTALTGYTAEEAVGQNARILKSGKQDEAFYRNLWQTISSCRVWSGEMINRRKDGSLYSESATITPLRNAEGVVARYIAIKQDITERKRAEETLRASQQIIEGIINAIPARVFWKDKNLVYLGCNTVFARDAGFADPKDIIGKDDSQMGWRDQAEKYRRDDRQVIESGISKLLIEEPQTTPGGDTITLLSSKLPLRGSKGEISGVLGMYLDITVRKRTEERLRRSETKFRTLYDTTADAVVLMDAKSFLDCNPATLTMFGYGSRKEFLSKHPADLSPPLQPDGADSLTLANQQIAIAVKKGSHRFEWMHKRADTGAVFPAEVLLSALELDGKWVLQVTVRDITERKRGEEALRKIKLQLAHAMSLAQLFAWDYDVASGLFSFSDSYYELHGTTAALENGNLMSAEIFAREFVHPDDAPRIAEEIGKAVATTDPNYHSQLECRIFRRDGELRHVLVHIAVTKDAKGRTIEIQGANQDITERKRFEAQLFQSQKMETVGKLAGGVAHEFNSIMTAIIGQSELVLYDLPEGNPLHKNVTEIRQAAERAAILTRQLLAYGRKQMLQPDVLDLNTIVAGMESTLRHLAGRDVDVYIAPLTGLKLIKADPGQIEQVIVNVVMNAVDAMPRGGKLTLETAEAFLDEEYVRHFSDLKAGDYIMLAITDTGPGMSNAVKARIFEPFFTTKEVGKGTGLGLAACHGIIKQSNGHISVYSEPGRGATFKIYLPRVRLEVKPPATPLRSPSMPGGTETILLVEDDPALREMAASLLGRLGYTVMSAGNGLEALNVTHQQATGHIDLLFTDVVMPHMGGKELAKRVQSLYSGTKVLFTSAYTENAFLHQGVLQPGITLLQKPFTPSSLAFKVREVLDSDKPDAAPSGRPVPFAHSALGE